MIPMPLSRDPEARKKQLANLQLGVAQRLKVKGGLVGIKMRFKKGYTPWNKGERGYKLNLSEQGRLKHVEILRRLKPQTRTSKETRSMAMKRVWRDPEYRRRALESYKKRVFPEERKLKIGKKSKELWRNREFREKTIRASMKALSKRPTKPEKKLMKLIDENSFPYKYVGDGSVVIYGLCPDFIECNGKKKIIEVFGDYWHTRPDTPYHQTEGGRKKIFKSLGYNTLVIWESELKEPDKVVAKIQEFERGY